MTDYLRLVRFPNLLIVAATQYFLEYLIIKPAWKFGRVVPALDDYHFFLLVLTTMILAAGGYVINDLTDVEADLVNKPDKVFINRVIPSTAAKHLYSFLFFGGLLISLYLAFHVKNLLLVLIYPMAWGLLWLYSKRLKKMPLTGNLVVAIFCAFVAGIVIFAERNTYETLLKKSPVTAKMVCWLFGGYLVFAFLSTLLREIVKDLEDYEGDCLTHARTMPVAWGVKTAKIIGLICGLALMLFLVPMYDWLIRNGNSPAIIFCTAGIFLPLLYIEATLLKSSKKEQFSRLSLILKLVMLAGLLLLLLIWMF